MIDHVIFDFFGTLVTYSDGIVGNPCARALDALAGRGVELDAVTFERMFAGCFETLESEASRSLEEYSMARAAALLFAELELDADDESLAGFVAAYLADWNEGVEALPRLEPWLRSLPVGKSVVTNTHHAGLVPDHLERLGVGHHVAHVTSSVEHGRRKPDPAIYEHHLEVLGLSTEQVVFVGDNPACDYHGPRAVGIEAFLIAERPVAGVEERYRLAHLYQLSERLATA